MSQQCVIARMKANQILSWIHRGITRRHRDMIISLYSALVRSTPGTLCPLLVPAIQKRQGQTIKGPKEDHEDDRRAAPWRKAKGIRSFYPREEKALGDLITEFHFLATKSVATKRMVAPPSQEGTWIGRRATRRDFILTQGRKFFLQRERSVTGATFNWIFWNICALFWKMHVFYNLAGEIWTYLKVSQSVLLMNTE